MYNRKHPLYSFHLCLILSAYIVLQYRVEEVVRERVDHRDVEQVGLLPAIASDTVWAPEIENW
jgi:hypothetical protein